MMGETQRQAARERNRQMKLAAARGRTHIGPQAQAHSEARVQTRRPGHDAGGQDDHDPVGGPRRTD
jgi:hypothetical protein